MKNPFIIPILSILKAHNKGLSEYEILRSLKSQFPDFCKLADDSNLCLFRQHFLVMNALYQLQSQLLQDEGLILSISPLKIQIDFTVTQETSTDTKKNQTELKFSAEKKIINYYLDWDEYIKTDEAEVEALLESFFKGLHNPSAIEEAFRTLQLPKTASSHEIRNQYRKLISRSHPDKGGSASDFIELKEAYELLSSRK
ncbi:DnaJ domain-containing protein [Marinomonas sp. 15G1-11]|uniref:DnaJ domain-containing protein n=1 Tax=Marinomonas phaeophyticola TaxID=3004091 RepID=A0ABT4JTE3_9GAMM|nr:DNA-J related domain-containing protein [Marinomonas sp. 15G1-11]MCZ2721292.1 DnaJ domain-containing protein [Marinomonas sp. 15G1-11]